MDSQPTRRSFSKKRHSKPCKFFQTNSCPRSADGCDFLHVLASEYQAKYPNPSTAKVCRYFMAGHCGNDQWCRFRHPTDCNNQPANVPLPPVYPTIATPGTHFPPPLAWSPADDTPVNLTLAHSQGYATPQATVASPSASGSGGSVPSLDFSTPSASSSFDDSMDDIHTHERPVDVHTPFTVLSPMISVSMYPMPFIPAHPGPFVPYGFHNVKPSMAPASRSQSRSRSTASPLPAQRKFSKYKKCLKAKPCKFYGVDRVCSNGDHCTFLHGNESRNSSPDRPSGEEEPSPNRKLEPNLPPKPISLKEENMKKGYFPVSWRVIGGGVPLGGSSSANDERSERPARGNRRPLESHIEAHKSREQERVLSTNDSPSVLQFPRITQPRPSLSISIPGPSGTDTAIPTPSPTPVKSSIRQRQRAKSGPPTSTVHVNFVSLFPAETPGGL